MQREPMQGLKPSDCAYSRNRTALVGATLFEQCLDSSLRWNDDVLFIVHRSPFTAHRSRLLTPFAQQPHAMVKARER